MFKDQQVFITTDYCLGIDVSDAQGIIDWEKVKNYGISFAFCKATEGETFVSKRFKYNWDNIKIAGIMRGAYHFCHTKNDPIKEANHFINTIGQIDDSDLLVLDIEDVKSKLNHEQFIDWTLTFLETVEQLTNTIPLVYTGAPYFDTCGGKPNNDIIKKLSRFPLWLAAYTTNPNKFVPYVWKDVGWTIWQRSGDVAAKGDKVLYVPGINSVVDKNQYNGTIEKFKIFVNSLHNNIAEKNNPESTILVDSTVKDPVILPLDVPETTTFVQKSFWNNLFDFLQKLFVKI